MKISTRSSLLSAAAVAATLVGNSASAASVYITEWMYSGASAGEFIEFTNLGPTAVDFTGWSFDDDSRVPGTVSLSAFGMVNSGESVILTESAASSFITAWGLTGVDVIGGNTTNLGRNDEINLYDAAGLIVDRLTFGDQTFPGTIRTQNISGNPISFYALGANNVSQWSLSSVGDALGSYAAIGGDIGNPGTTGFAPVPVPAAFWLLGSGLAGLFGFGRRKQANA